VWGYAGLKEIMADPGHEQHQEMLDWLCLASADSFDPKAFSIDDVNARLARLGRPVSPRATCWTGRTPVARPFVR
jgi:hypothetical protein